jgi:hypothetical protein
MERRGGFASRGAARRQVVQHGLGAAGCLTAPSESVSRGAVAGSMEERFMEQRDGFIELRFLWNGEASPQNSEAASCGLMEPRREPLLGRRSRLLRASPRPGLQPPSRKISPSRGFCPTQAEGLQVGSPTWQRGRPAGGGCGERARRRRGRHASAPKLAPSTWAVGARRCRSVLAAPAAGRRGARSTAARPLGRGRGGWGAAGGA